MDDHFKEFFHGVSEDAIFSNFFNVIVLQDAPDVSWDVVSAKVPGLSRAWFELAQLVKEDRIEFLRQFWFSKLVGYPSLIEFLTTFFARVEDVGVFVTQEKKSQPFEAQIVYLLKEGGGFYRGLLPAAEEHIIQVENAFPDFILPRDYLSFLEVHNGFYKTMNTAGIMTSHQLREDYENFQKLFTGEDPILTENGQVVDPKKLIPFYKSTEGADFQCFWADWYPENEMGVVYFSGKTKRVSDVSDGGGALEHLCFPTFSDWLIFYLEPLDLD